MSWGFFLIKFNRSDKSFSKFVFIVIYALISSSISSYAKQSYVKQRISKNRIPAQATKKEVKENAQPSETVTIVSLNDAIKKGFDYSPDIKKADSQLKQQDEQLSKARGMLFPAINAQASAISHQNSATFTSANIPSFQEATGDNYIVGLTFTQPLYVGGALTSGISLTKNQWELAKQNLFGIKQTVGQNVIGTYLTWVQAHELYRTAKLNLEILRGYLDITVHYEHIGRSRPMDKLQAAVNLQLAEADVEQQRILVVQSELNLKKTLGELTNQTDWKPDYKPSVEIVEALTLDQAFDKALENNPTIRTTELTGEQVQYNKDIDLAADLPNLQLQGQGGYNSPDTPSLFNPSSQYFQIGLTLVVPLFSGLTSVSKRGIYQEEDYQAKRDLQNAKDNLRVQIDIAVKNMRSLQVQLKIAQDSAKSAVSALNMANKSYQQGVAQGTDVINLQNTKYNADKLLIASEFGYMQSLLTLRNLMGIDLEKTYVH